MTQLITAYLFAGFLVAVWSENHSTWPSDRSKKDVLFFVVTLLWLPILVWAIVDFGGDRP